MFQRLTAIVSTMECVILRHYFTCTLLKKYNSSYKCNNMDVMAIVIFTYSWLKLTGMLLFAVYSYIYTNMHTSRSIHIIILFVANVI